MDDDFDGVVTAVDSLAVAGGRLGHEGADIGDGVPAEDHGDQLVLGPQGPVRGDGDDVGLGVRPVEG